MHRFLVGLSSLVMLSIAPAAFAAADIIGQASVIDGDTIEIHGQRIRLFGIDAPEHDQLCEEAGAQYRCGQQASLALADQIGRQTVDCAPRDVDQYGRVVAVCSAAGEDLNAWMVRQGWALAYRHYSTAYVPDEDAAHLAGDGIWRGTFDAPWDWRQGKRQGAAQVQSQAPVSGNTTPANASSRATSAAKARGSIMYPAAGTTMPR